jgi:hypothetical protein
MERPYIEGASHLEETQQTQHILTRRKRVRLFLPPMMSTTNITTHVLPGGDSKEPQGQAINDQRPILTWTQETNALPSRPSLEWTLASCTLQQKMCNVFSLELPQTSYRIQCHPYHTTTMTVVTSMDWTRGASCKNKRQPSTFCTMHSIALGFPQTCCSAG